MIFMIASHIQKYGIVSKVRAHLPQASASTSTLRQLCSDTSDSVLIANNGVTREWFCNPFSSDLFVFNENRIASVTAELSQR